MPAHQLTKKLRFFILPLHQTPQRSEPFPISLPRASLTPGRGCSPRSPPGPAGGDRRAKKTPPAAGGRQEGGEAGGGRAARRSPAAFPPSRCQVRRGGVGARGGDGWRLSSPGSRNANSARNGEATGGGGEARQLPQAPPLPIPEMQGDGAS